ncbi:MAG: cytochrome c biogenesis protein CcdA [Clostridiales bacterium]|nr:cytochrome c biogenesis protein CcdA [Clostridiales bacterium]
MEYLITFLEGLITFVSPCLLPMLPIYISYFAGGQSDDGKKSHKGLINAIAFVGGFTIVFVLLGVFAGSVGSFFLRHQKIIHTILGIIVIIFGLQYLGLFRGLFPSLASKIKFTPHQGMNVGKSFLFGMIIFVSWTPCAGPLLGAALAQASQGATALKGATLLLSYSLGLGIPFLLGAVLMEQLQGVFTFIKKHYRVIQIISGAFLIVVGILMITGTLFAWMQQISGSLT